MDGVAGLVVRYVAPQRREELPCTVPPLATLLPPSRSPHSRHRHRCTGRTPQRGLGIAGWDKPVDPLGGCRFLHNGDRLTITLPGGHRRFQPERVELTSPRLLRAVEGEFTAQVRVGGEWAVSREDERRGAGLVLTDGEASVRFYRVADCLQNNGLLVVRPAGLCVFIRPFFRKPTHLQFERRKDLLTMKYSTDGRRWETADRIEKLRLAKGAKVGVFAEVKSSRPFKPVFDEFSLTPLK